MNITYLIVGLVSLGLLIYNLPRPPFPGEIRVN